MTVSSSPGGTHTDAAADVKAVERALKYAADKLNHLARYATFRTDAGDLEISDPDLLEDLREAPSWVIGAGQEAFSRLAAALDAATQERDRLVAEIDDYMLWEPGRAGHAAAHHRLRLAAAASSSAGDTDTGAEEQT